MEHLWIDRAPMDVQDRPPVWLLEVQPFLVCSFHHWLLHRTYELSTNRSTVKVLWGNFKMNDSHTVFTPSWRPILSNRCRFALSSFQYPRGVEPSSWNLEVCQSKFGKQDLNASSNEVCWRNNVLPPLSSTCLRVIPYQSANLTIHLAWKCLLFLTCETPRALPICASASRLFVSSFQ